MPKTKRIPALLLCIAIAASLCACGAEKPTAKSLLENAMSMDAAKYQKFTVSINTAADYSPYGETTSTRYTVETKDKITHVYDLSIDVGSDGENRFQASAETWDDGAANTSYTKLELDGNGLGGAWVKTATDDAALQGSDIGAGGGMSTFLDIPAILEQSGAFDESAEIALSEDGSTYRTEWTHAETDGSDSENPVTLTMKNIVTFNKETGRVTRIEQSASDNDAADAVHIVLEYQDIDAEQDLAIPQDVVDSALDYSQLVTDDTENGGD